MTDFRDQDLVVNETWEHRLYAERDLTALENPS
jgi:hypothetical protein